MQKLVMESRVWTRFSEPLNKWERKKEKIESKVKPKKAISSSRYLTVTDRIQVSSKDRKVNNRIIRWIF